MSDSPDLRPSNGLVIAMVLGIASFWAQKQTDRIDSDIDAIYDSVASVSNFKMNYVNDINDINDAYLDNVTEFSDLVGKCGYIREKLQKDKDCCSYNYPDAGGLRVSDLYKSFDLFSNKYLDQPNFDFNKLVESDSFLRPNIKYTVLQEMLNDNKSLRETFATMQADLASMSDIASQNKATISKYKDEDIIKQIQNKDVECLSYSICCTVIEMHNSSVSLSDYANNQLRSFCEVRRETYNFIKEKQSYRNHFYWLVSELLFYDRADTLRAALEKESEEPSRCAWTPKPPCSHNDVCDFK